MSFIGFSPFHSPESGEPGRRCTERLRLELAQEAIHLRCGRL